MTFIIHDNVYLDVRDMSKSNDFHLAIIPDGNRRWAKAHGVSEIEGHRAGVQKLHDVVRWSKELGVTTLSIWIFSTENTGRSKLEVEGLLRLFEMMLEKIENDGGDYKELRESAWIRFIGKPELRSKSAQKRIKSIEDKTAKNKDFTLVILFGYGGRQEIVDATNRAIVDAKEGKIDVVDESSFRNYLYAPDIRDPDLVFRSAGEKRFSGFEPWQTAYSELYFSEKLWPDVTKEDFKTAIEEYKSRERRFGK